MIWSHYVFASFIVFMVSVMTIVVVGVFSCLAFCIFKNKTNKTDIDEEARIIPIQKEGELNYGMDIQTEQVPSEEAISTDIE